MDPRTEERRRALVEKLHREGFESRYLETLRARVDPAAAMQELERELTQEIALSLGRAAAHVEFALLELEVMERDLDAMAPDDPKRPALVEAFNKGRKVAEDRRLDLLIQREAIGITQNAILETMYPIPPRRH